VFALELLLLLTVLAQWHFIFGLIFEITLVLKIRIFKVKPVSFV